MMDVMQIELIVVALRCFSISTFEIICILNDGFHAGCTWRSVYSS